MLSRPLQKAQFQIRRCYTEKRLSLWGRVTLAKQYVCSVWGWHEMRRCHHGNHGKSESTAERWWNAGKRHTNTTRDHPRPPVNKGCFSSVAFEDGLCCSLTHVINIYTIKETGASCHVEMISQGLYSTYRVLSQKPKDKMLNCKKTTKKKHKNMWKFLEKKPLLWEHWVSFTKHAYAHLYELGRKFLWEVRMCV